MLKERYILASERIREIPEEKGMVEASFMRSGREHMRKALPALPLPAKNWERIWEGLSQSFITRFTAPSSRLFAEAWRKY